MPGERVRLDFVGEEDLRHAVELDQRLGADVFIVAPSVSCQRPVSAR